ncbi:hypothetical protein GWK47_012185 [Chionoecetes opilio]|uniref:Uncharacterized protein n=1 Tax=Chionoecetes opilio TaxID=41210 RepID=A0A8J4Y5P2_CHIOP|nr:hypothetical protein GWK47_012185 [Chionoecetes opilio]
MERTSPGASVYGSFLEKVTQFRELNALPVPLAFGAATDVDELIRNHAQWDKSCHDQSTHRNWQGRRSEGEIALLLQKTDAVVHGKCFDKTSCIFCTKKDGLLHEFKTLGADDHVRSMARDLLDSDLLTRIEGVGDLIALEAKYHLACLVGLRNRHRSPDQEQGKTYRMPVNQTRKPEQEPFAELVTYIENEVEERDISLQVCFPTASLRKSSC